MREREKSKTKNNRTRIQSVGNTGLTVFIMELLMKSPLNYLPRWDTSILYTNFEFKQVLATYHHRLFEVKEDLRIKPPE